MKTKVTRALLLIPVVLILLSCNNINNNKIITPYTPKAENFDTTIDGKSVKLYSLKNKNGVEIWATNYGCRIVSFFAPDKNGRLDDIVLGYRSIQEYVSDNFYLGCVVGRYANRICKGNFSINGNEYTLAKNNGPNALHGGIKGFDKVVWDAVADSNSITFTYTSPDMDEGFPGNLTSKVIYTLTDDNELKIDYQATTDKPTIVNLTQHSYFNLNLNNEATILDHILQLNADYITPVDSTLIPTGELMSVENTPFDFRSPKRIGQQISDENIQLTNGGGYDHNWVLKKDSNELSLAAILTDTVSGRVLEVYTTEPGVQFYSGNFLNNSVNGKSGKPFQYRMALALETQHFPNSPNQPNFPGVVLIPGGIYKQTCIYKISVLPN